MKMSLLLPAIVLGAASLAFSSGAIASTVHTTTVMDPVTGLVYGVGNAAVGVVHGAAYGAGAIVTGTGHVVNGAVYGTDRAVTHTTYHHGTYHHTTR